MRRCAVNIENTFHSYWPAVPGFSGKQNRVVYFSCVRFSKLRLGMEESHLLLLGAWPRKQMTKYNHYDYGKPMAKHKDYDYAKT